MSVLRRNATRALVLALMTSLWGAGCTPGLVSPMVSQQPNLASLRLKVDRGMGLQLIAKDVANLRVELTFEDGRVESRVLPKNEGEMDYLDLSNLPPGEASIKVTALSAGGDAIGHGYSMALLMPGRRSYAALRILLDSQGQTYLNPFSPLTSLADQNVLGSQLHGRVIASRDPGEELRIIAYYREAAGSSYMYSVGSTLATAVGTANFFNLSDAIYQLGYQAPGYGGIGYMTSNDGGFSLARAMPRRPEFALSAPVRVSADQEVAPEVTFDLDWDLRDASPAINSVLPSREVTFDFPAKTGLADPKYAIEIFDSFDGNLLVPVQRFESSANDLVTGRTRVSFTLADEVRAGTRYYLLRYWEGSGTYGGNNAFGRTPLIPFIVPTRDATP